MSELEIICHGATILSFMSISTTLTTMLLNPSSVKLISPFRKTLLGIQELWAEIETHFTEDVGEWVRKNLSWCDNSHVYERFRRLRRYHYYIATTADAEILCLI